MMIYSSYTSRLSEYSLTEAFEAGECLYGLGNLLFYGSPFQGEAVEVLEVAHAFGDFARQLCIAIEVEAVEVGVAYAGWDFAADGIVGQGEVLDGGDGEEVFGQVGDAVLDEAQVFDAGELCHFLGIEFAVIACHILQREDFQAAYVPDEVWQLLPVGGLGVDFEFAQIGQLGQLWGERLGGRSLAFPVEEVEFGAVGYLVRNVGCAVLEGDLLTSLSMRYLMLGRLMVAGNWMYSSVLEV